MSGKSKKANSAITYNEKTARKNAEAEIQKIERWLRSLQCDLADYEIGIAQTKVAILKYQKRLDNLHNFLEYGDEISTTPLCEE